MYKNYIKRTAAALLAVSVLSLSACSDDGEDYGEDNSSSYAVSSGNTDANADSRDEAPSYNGSSISGARASRMSLSGTGLNIDRLSRETTAPMGDDGTWTIFVYMCGTDLESENGMASGDITEMIGGYTDENIKFVVQTGGTNGWSDFEINSGAIQRYVITGGEMTLADEQPLSSMGSADTLSSFLDWGIDNYPAANMGVIFWDHGGGSISGVCFDELNDSDSLTLTEIDTALTSVYDKMTDKFEFVGYDACLMGTIENANMLVPHANYMFASEELEPGYGWNYTKIGEYLTQNPSCDGAALGKVVADSFMEMCEEIDAQDSATFSITDLSKIDAVVEAFNSAAQQMYNAAEDSSSLAGLVRNINGAKNYGGNNDSEGYTNMVDLGALLLAAQDYADVDAAVSAIGSAVIYNLYGWGEEGSTGLSTYFPLYVSGSEELSVFKDICISPYYMTFVDRIAYGSSNGGMMNDYSGDNLWLDENECYWTEDSWSNSADYFSYWGYFDDNNSDNMTFADSSSTINFAEAPHLNDDGTYTFTLTEDSIDYTAGVYCSIYLTDTENGFFFDIGSDNYTKVDWETGVVEDCFDGLWYMLPDGQPLAMFIVEEAADHDIYTAPVNVNGKRTNLRILMQYTDDGYTTSIIGTWDGIDENGQAARDIRTLEVGDVITPLYGAYSFDGSFSAEMPGNDYTYDGNSTIYDNTLGAGDYYYCFRITDIFGESYFTEFVMFTIDEDGNIYYNA